MPLSPELWPRVKALFERAVELPREERTAWLERECPDDEQTRREVETLLAADAGNDEFIEESIGRFPAQVIAEHAGDDTLIGRRFGAYEILRELGRGGISVVYLAERADEQFHKRVAIKLIKRGLDTDEIQRRFRR